ncbi:hypothetical protein FFLO_05686 [Filobasidium floriforme]|uniref:Pentulose kinase n=1 Tax=Filobasidium floriforme TaxID=5210 RepID=A0A8K0NNL8_9TREE|nr:hypothetical protein FFLO_05686 [Filobasidium floriforme]
MSEQSYYIGFDVGTGSARAALLDSKGKIIADATENTKTYRSETDHRIYEQSTQNIWSSLALCCNRVLSTSGIPASQIKGISFDATCSLCVVDGQGVPVCVTEGEGLGKSGEEAGDRNVILWADHRAEEEAAFINQTGEGVLGFVGGVMSLEMEIPKTLWLKKHMKEEDFEKSFFFELDLTVTYRATESIARSNCSLTCKFSYVSPGVKVKHLDGKEESSEGWSAGFLNKIGLESLVKRDFEQVGGQPGKNGLIMTAGQPVGTGLTERAAKEFGLLPGTPVGSAVIDAYAGWVGTIAAKSSADKSTERLKLEESSHRLAACAGTSTCHIVQSDKGVFVDGWGPYPNAVFPGWWMNEGGQSSTGQLIDFIINTHPALSKAQEQAKESGKGLFDFLEDKLEELKKTRGVSSTTELTKHLHFYPDLGNRSPLADVKMKGMITGLTLDSGVNDLAVKFHVTLEAIALQTRHILDEMNAKGHVVDSIYMSGSQAKNKPLMQLLASVCNVAVFIPPHPSAAVVMGAAMMGRCAANISEKLQGKPIETQEEQDRIGVEMQSELWDVMAEMTPEATAVISDASDLEKKLLDVKYKIFRESIEIQKRWRDQIDVVGN